MRRPTTPYEDRKKFYVTRDVEALMGSWCSARGLRCPDQSFFKELSDELKGSFETIFAQEVRNYRNYPALQNMSRIVTEVDFLEYIEIAEILSKKYARQQTRQTFWVTLDRAYTKDPEDFDWRIEVTRIYSADGGLKIGTGLRPEWGERPQGDVLGFAVGQCAEQIRRSGAKRVILVDDGLFSGSTMIQILELLHKESIPIYRVQTALARQEGAQALFSATKRIKEQNRSYSQPEIDLGTIKADDQVRDWVCERDFLFGVPLGGKTVGELLATAPLALPESTGIAYSCLSANDLYECASVRHGAQTLARTSLILSIRLWERIEAENPGFHSLIQELPRIPSIFIACRQKNPNVIVQMKMLMDSFGWQH